jgi:hypothetical protein
MIRTERIVLFSSFSFLLFFNYTRQLVVPTGRIDAVQVSIQLALMRD